MCIKPYGPSAVFRRADQRRDQRWQEREAHTPRQLISTRATRVVEGWQPADVWAFIRPAESSVVIDANVVKAFTVPGTGPGPGEQQICIYRQDGYELANMATVVAVQEGIFAELISYQPGMPSGTRTDLAEVIGGTRITLTSWADPVPGLAVDRFAVRTALEQHGESYVLRVKTILEAQSLGDVLPSPEG